MRACTRVCTRSARSHALRALARRALVSPNFTGLRSGTPAHAERLLRAGARVRRTANVSAHTLSLSLSPSFSSRDSAVPQRKQRARRAAVASASAPAAAASASAASSSHTAAGGSDAAASAPAASDDDGGATDDVVGDDGKGDMDSRKCPHCGGPKVLGGACKDKKTCSSVDIAPVAVSKSDALAFYSKYFSDGAVSTATSAPQGSATWLAARLVRLTASDAGALCGLSPYGNAQTVISGKVAALAAAAAEPPPPNDHMKYGSAMEPVVRAAVAGKWGMEIPVPAMIVAGHLGCSSDGVIEESSVSGDLRIGIEIKCPSPFSPTYIYRKRGTSIPGTHLYQMLLCAAVSARNGEPLDEMRYVVLLKGVIYVTTLQLGGDAGKPLRELGESIFMGLEQLHQDVLMPAIVTGVVPLRVRNVHVPIPPDASAALVAANEATAFFQVDLVEPASVGAIRLYHKTALALPAAAPAVPGSLLASIGVPLGIEAHVRFFLSNGGCIIPGMRLALQRGPTIDPLSADIYDSGVTLALALVRDEYAARLGLAGYTTSLAFATGARFVARGASALAGLLIEGHPLRIPLATAAALGGTFSPLFALIAQRRGAGQVRLELDFYQAFTCRVVTAPSDDARRELLAQPAACGFYSGASNADLRGGDGAYFVCSNEHAKRRAARENLVYVAKPGDFLPKVGVGPARRGRSQAEAGGVRETWLFAMPAELPRMDALTRAVLVGAEALLTLIHSPVSLSLLGVGIFGDLYDNPRAGGM